MSEHKAVVKNVIIKLYQHISNPSAKVARIRDIGLRALDELSPPEAPFDYDALNMKEARQAVEDGKISREEALIKEKAGKQRAQLLKWLEGGE